jgi:hypothetical protein
MVFPFERSGDLMIVAARVWGARGDRRLLLVIDTGSAATSIEPPILRSPAAWASPPSGHQPSMRAASGG